MRLEGKTAIIIGAGQGPGEGIGNGRATALRFAREGAKVMAVDRDLLNRCFRVEDKVHEHLCQLRCVTIYVNCPLVEFGSYLDVPHIQLVPA